MAEGSRLARWWGLVTLAGRRVLSSASGMESRQVALHVAGVAIPVALMLVVTSVSVGLATGTTVRSPDVDYWIVPESGNAQSAVVSVSGPQFGRVHQVSDRLNGREDIAYATPVLLELLQLQSGETTEYVLAVGVIPGETPTEIGGVSTAALAAGDPHFANGTYNGTWTGEAALSAAAAELLGARNGNTLAVSRPTGRPINRTVTVVGTSRGGEAVVGELPIALVHLSELQTITGAAAGDQADQILVETTRPEAKAALATVYPRSVVLSRVGLTTREVGQSQLPLALGVAGLVVAVVLGLLFAASTMGLAIADDSRNRAVLRALGVSGRSRATIVATQALIVTLIGGIVGVGLGVVGVRVTNVLAQRYIVDVPVASFHPTLVAYGIGVALVIGLLTVPYLLVVSRRTTTIDALRE